MKKLFALIITAAMLATALVSCGGPKDDFVYMDSKLVDDGYITLGEYKNLVVNPIEVTEDEINEHVVEHLGHSDEESEVEDRAAEDGDAVNIDYLGKVDGTEFEGGAAEDTDLVIGLGNYIDGFEEGIVGMKAGETKTINVTFPEDYHSEDLKGKAATFDITLNSVYSDKVFEEAEAELYAEKLEKLADDSEGVMKTLVWDKIMENTTVNKYPEGVVEKLINDLANNQIAQYYSWGITDLSMFGMTEESIREQMKTEAETIIKEELVIYAIAQAEGMSVSEDEFNAKVEVLAKASDVTAEEYLKYFTRQSIETKIYYDKVIALATSTATEASAE